MKRTNSLLLVMVLATATVANAQLLSPRAEANKTRVVPGSASEVDLTRKADGPALSPRASASQTKVSVKCPHEGDTVAPTRASKLSPRAQSQGAGGTKFEVAAVGEKKDCGMACCKK